MNEVMNELALNITVWYPSLAKVNMTNKHQQKTNLVHTQTVGKPVNFQNSLWSRLEILGVITAAFVKPSSVVQVAPTLTVTGEVSFNSTKQLSLLSNHIPLGR